MISPEKPGTGNNADFQVDIFGHSAFKMTQRYAHLAPDHKKIAVNMLDFDAKGQAAPEEVEKTTNQVPA